MDERKQESRHLGWQREKNDEGGRQKRCERLTSMRTIIGERKPNDRYDVRSSDCHVTDAHMSEGKLSNVTSWGASNFFSHEDLELI